jgi:hypothetical protein
MKNEIKGRAFKGATVLGVALLMLCTPSISLGWGAGGHMIVATIAYKQLNGRAKAKADKLLLINVNPLGTKDNDFVNVAHWADDIRQYPGAQMYSALHFIDIPFATDGTALPKRPIPNIVTALQDNVELLRKSSDLKQQALALRFIIHFVGDIHQPLHCATRVDRAHPDGDRGGNLVRILVPDQYGKPRETNLHSYWDSGLDSFPQTGAGFTPPSIIHVYLEAESIKDKNPKGNFKLKDKDAFNFEGWADESFQLAQTIAYVGIADGKTPSAAYKARSLPVVQQRVALAGYRLAALLNAIWP